MEQLTIKYGIYPSWKAQTTTVYLSFIEFLSCFWIIALMENNESPEIGDDGVQKSKTNRKKKGGRNCAIPGCTASENGLYPGVRYFQVTTRSSQYYDYDGWRENIIHIIRTHREIPINELRERVMKGKVHICNRHYADEDIEHTGTPL